jgi:hypothetical protein
MEPEEAPIPFSQRQKVEGPIPFSQRTAVTPAEAPAQVVTPFSQRVKTEPSYVQEVTDTIKAYGRGLTREDFLKDPKLMSFVRNGLSIRNNNGGFVNSTADAAITAAGGVAINFVDKLNDEDAFELWQNRHRSFAGGQTVTTFGEARIATFSDEETRARLGADYLLFDSMDNAFTGNGTWGETFDALGDYASAAIWDPTTVVGLGVGRLYTAGGAKAASQGIKLAAQETFKNVLQREVAKGVAKQVATQTAKAAAKSAAKKGFMKIGMKQAAVMATPDIIANVGLDALYQNTMIKTGVQEEFSFSQSAVAAMGAIALPLAVGATKLSVKGVERVFKGTKYEGTFSAYKELKNTLAGKSPAQITAAIKQRINLNAVDASLRSTFDDFNKNIMNYLPWADAKVEAGKLLKANNLPVGAEDVDNLFWHTFLTGDQKGKSKGFIESLSDAGFVMVDRDPLDKTSNWIGDAISWMPDNLVSKIVTDFESAIGVKLDVGTTGAELAVAFKKRASNAGQILADSSYASRMLREKAVKKPGMARMLKGLGGQALDKHPPEYLGYVQSVWKRLMTSAPATVALNVKGWSASVLLNSYSDAVNGALYSARAVGKAALGDVVGAKDMLQKGKGTILGMMKRGYAIVDYDSTLDTAKNFFEFNPDVHELLFKNLGDTDAVGSLLKRYNLSESNTPLRGLERSVEAVQTVTGTLLQDEVTKSLSFVTNLEQRIMMEYGLSYNDFLDKFGKDAFLEMQTERFVTKAVAPALDRTLRETFSKSWSDKVGAAPMLKVAKAVEAISSHSYGGFVVPFGRFFNTSIAFLGDTTGINAFRWVLKKFGGYDVDLAQESGQELLAKGIAGWSLFTYFALKGQEKIENGLAWNQERDETTGEIRDVTYDSPEAYYHLIGQLLGHRLLKDGEVSEDLKAEAFSMVTGQIFRSGEESLKLLSDFVQSALAGDTEELSSTFLDIMLASATNITSGTTRFLDPINQAAMVVTGDYEAPDRRQGYKFFNESLRYVDKLPGLLGMEDNREPRWSPTQGKVPVDVNKSFGERTTPENSPINMLLNSIGSRDWQKIKWGGDPEVKNRMDELIYPALNTLAASLLEKEPDFFKQPLGYRQNKVQAIITAAKAQAQAVLDTGVGKDEGLKLLRELSSLPNQANVKKALDYLGIEESPVDIVALEGGPDKLRTLIHLAKNWDKIMYESK